MPRPAYRRRHRVATALGLVLATGCSLTIATVARAQGTAADYERAASLGRRFDDTVFRARLRPRWLEGGDRFWYRVDTGPGTHEFVLVDAAKGTRAPAFDQARMAEALGKATGQPAAADRLPIDNLDVAADGASLTVRVGGDRWRCDLATYELAKVEGADAEEDAPDGFVPPTSRPGNEETALTFVNRTDAPIELFWVAPEGEKRSYGTIEPGGERRQHTFAGHVWEATAPDGRVLRRAMGREEPTRVVVDGKTPPQAPPEPRRRGRRGGFGADGAESPDGRWRAVVKDHNLYLRDLQASDDEAAETALTTDGSAADAYGGPLLWSPDGSHLLAVRTIPAQEHPVHMVESSPRDQVQPRLRTIDYLKPGDRIAHPRPRLFRVADRSAITLDESLFPNPWSLEEYRWGADGRSFTFLYNQRGHQVMRLLRVDAATGAARAVIDEASPTFIDYAHKTFLHRIESANELLWMSERDGWNHLYRIDAATGAIKNQVTKGSWGVRRVERVDEETGQVWFFAMGVKPEQDPYYQHLCRVNLDGSGFVMLTDGDGTHEVQLSPDRRYLVDTWSRVDQAPMSVLRASEDGRKICDLETADVSRLLAAGFAPPERFTAKGRDGTTDIFGIIVRPTNFDPAKRYPVVESLYAGPQDFFVPKAWGTQMGQRAIAELGFIVVQIDGMGTNWRSRAFHDVCWKNLKDAGLPDRVLWLRAAAAERPWMDLSRVGVYGGSAGGQNAMRALLDHGDVYKVGVADCGCHDNRMDKIWWNELWMGWPVGPEYAASSNVVDAHKLTGKLLLVVGELDTNVDPASTMQVVDALVRADKDFDFLVVPGANHGASGTPYGRRRLADFLVRHLLGVEPRSR